MKAICVITTINQPTKAIEVLHDKFGSNLIIVGDKKTPEGWAYKDAQYLLNLPAKGWYQGYAPANSYARKNLGYLEAMRQGAEVIYESDDDNVPNKIWEVRQLNITAYESLKQGWCNVYRHCSKEDIWPRGFSLRHINDPVEDYGLSDEKAVNSSIQQGLADGEPDVDAIWRLVLKNTNHFQFEGEGSIYMPSGSWCPFNSQSTWWFPKAFPLMYLPVYSTFRMTDIWRSFVAQKCLWAMGDGVTFHSPSEVFQDRNEHDLLADFKDEIDGYLHNDKIIEILSNLTLKQGEENVCDNLFKCWESIVNCGILPQMELRALGSWIRDYKEIVNLK